MRRTVLLLPFVLGLLVALPARPRLGETYAHSRTSSSFPSSLLSLLSSFSSSGLLPMAEGATIELREMEAEEMRVLSMSGLRMRLGIEALRAQMRRAALGELPSCEGLVSEMCKPCPKGGNPGFCKTILGMCAQLFCSPMCKRDTWKCSIEFGSFAQEAADKSYEEALCTQFIAYGCQKMLGCCNLDEYLIDYTENGGFVDQYPDPRMPTPGCLQGPRPKLCRKCKQAVKVKVEPVVCPFPEPEGVNNPDPKDNELAKDAAGNAFPGTHAHKGLQERCTKLEAKVKAKFPPMKAAFQGNVCKCMGCCEGECYYPLTEKFKPGGWEVNEAATL